MSSPSDILDLANWTLTGPTDARSIISASSLVNGFADERFFFVRDDAVIFKTPKTGSTTANSTKPRSELREQLYPPSNERNWPLAGEHVLNAYCAVNAVPKDDRVFIAQIHGKRWNHPVMKLSYKAKDGRVWLDVKKGPNGSDIKEKFGQIKLKKFFRYEVRVEDGKLHVTVNEKTLFYDLRKFGFKVDDKDWYFKAGAYSGPAEVAFRELERSHS